MMEGIVYGLANIHFQQNLVEFRDENRTRNYIPMASSSADIFPQSQDEPIGNSQHFGDAACSSAASSSSSFVDDNSWEEADDDEGALNVSHTKGLTFAERRQLPSRSSKEKSLLGTKRRSIMKPTKRVSSVHKDLNSMRPGDIKRLYMNKKLTKFRPTSLETIIEESSPPNSQSNVDEEDQNTQIRFLGTRKYRRAVTFHDCNFVNKDLIKKRRAKIKKLIGRRPALKKISLEEFISKLNSSMEEKQTTHKTTASENMDEGYCHIETALSNSNNIQVSITSSLAFANVGAVTEETMELTSAAKHDEDNHLR